MRVTPMQRLLLMAAAISFPVTPAAERFAREEREREEEVARLAALAAAALDLDLMTAQDHVDRLVGRGWSWRAEARRLGELLGRGEARTLDEVAAGVRRLAEMPREAPPVFELPEDEVRRRLAAPAERLVVPRLPDLGPPRRERGCAPHPSKLQKLARRRNRRRR